MQVNREKEEMDRFVLTISPFFSKSDWCSESAFSCSLEVLLGSRVEKVDASIQSNFGVLEHIAQHGKLSCRVETHQASGCAVFGFDW
jgi:hypothetical protein